VILELTEGEADLIHCVISGFIGGDATDSPRKYADRISQALTDTLGYDWEGTDAYKLRKRDATHNGLIFNKYSELEPPAPRQPFNALTARPRSWVS
jgi:hypothetical protein